MKIFLDFDDVIFNTRDFSRDYKKIFENFGVCKDIFHELYFDYPQKDKKGGLLKYNLEKHIKRIGEECKMETKELRKEIENFLSDTRKYIFPDVQFFLSQFEKDQLFILSYGESKLQKKKIINSGIGDFFKKIIIVDVEKGGPLKKEVAHNEEVYFFDDRVEQVASVKEELPESKTFLVKRAEARYDDDPNKSCDFVINNLGEGLKLIFIQQKTD